ncbi:cytoplasmic dynein 1 light intermediate chain 1-like isoform X2 [Scleropages formosus]|uniref:cytoplasmic dynein 1 light intermediate chain 1-like isoform X2 n=1 Tax=Scleropages formosus TaxID=113540 RepID=UPI0010FA6C8C|nr:cytoplasmic dynein 1 light intermediate chain 1-like isoform X2 [Scleropages formosus]
MHCMWLCSKASTSTNECKCEHEKVQYYMQMQRTCGSSHRCGRTEEPSCGANVGAARPRARRSRALSMVLSRRCSGRGNANTAGAALEHRGAVEPSGDPPRARSLVDTSGLPPARLQPTKMAALDRSCSASVQRAAGNALPQGPSGDEDDGHNLWSSILSEVSAHSRSKLPSGKSVLVLGDVGCGKTTLVARLQGVEEYLKGRGLEYLYFNVHDDDIDDDTRCNAWVLDGDLYHKGLQKFAVNRDNVSDSAALLVVDMSRPWTAMDSLQKWAGVLREHIDRLRLPPESMRDMERKLVRQFQEYMEPGGDLSSSPQRRNITTSDTDGESVLLPLGESTLTHNLGVPLIVVCTKCDAVSSLEKEQDYRDEHFDFIQSHIRRFCLQYGATLLYTSVKENKNLDILYKYLVHRLYGFPFSIAAQVVEKDAVFIPAGWENEKKIAILHENFQTIKVEDNFEDVIVKPPVRKFVHEKEILAEDDQVFLTKLQSLTAKQPAAAAGRPMVSTLPCGAPVPSPVENGLQIQSTAGVRLCDTEIQQTHRAEPRGGHRGPQTAQQPPMQAVQCPCRQVDRRARVSSPTSSTAC